MIRRLLVVGRNDVAARIFATCRAIGIETVAVFTDAEANAPYVSQADYAVRIADGEPAGGDVARYESVLAAIRRSGADAAHPGCGRLAEDPAFAAAIDGAGATWVGPPPAAMAIARSKPAIKSALLTAGIPVLPTYQGPGDVTSFPVLLKAVTGHGGRGMRVARDREALLDAAEAARREAELSYGNDEIFAERYLPGARHIEVQIIADTAGTVVPLGERECSVQRHRRAVLVEAPSPAVDPGRRAELFTAAVAAARAIGYVGLGTVEFLLAPSGEFYFLELTPRLQPTHSVTECVFGLDLVRLQLIVAEGGVLPFTTAPPMRGHAIESRLTAEDPAYDWRATEGTLRRLEVPGVAHRFGPLIVPGLRMDPAVTTGSTVTARSLVGEDDVPLLARLTSWAPTRHEATRMLATALAHARLHGIITDRDLLVRVLRHPAFRHGDTNIGFLDQHPDVFAPLLSSLEAVKLSCLAAAIAGAARQRLAAPGVASLPPGWRNVPSTPQTVAYDGPTGTLEVAYLFDRDGNLATWSVRGVKREDVGRPRLPDIDDTIEIGTNAGAAATALDAPEVAVLVATPERVELEVAGVRLAFDIHQVDGEPAVCYVDGADGSVALTELPRFPSPAKARPEGALCAPLPGTVVQVLVVPGQRVAMGDLLFMVRGTAAADAAEPEPDPDPAPPGHPAAPPADAGHPPTQPTPPGRPAAPPADAECPATVEHGVRAPVDGVVSGLWVTHGSPVEAGELLARLAPD